MIKKSLIVALWCVWVVASVCAQSRYPHSRAVPEEVVWMREIYRTLDLTRDANGALYYPIEPATGRANLLTLVFNLLADNKIPVYEYTLDGNEHLTPDRRVTLAGILERFQLPAGEVPSAEVKSYFIKEVWYFDQRTSTFGSAVTAFCPVMHRAADFSLHEMKLPMFWVDYRDVAPYLATAHIPTSSRNNAAARTIDDFFATRLYQGDIYKTTNMQNRSLSHYCESDTALANEQKRIEAEIAAFEAGLYGTTAVTKKDSVAIDKEKPAKQAVRKESSAPKATVRRERK